MPEHYELLNSALDQATGFIYPNEVELHWGLLVVIYPYITGLVAGAFILASLEKVFRVKEVEPTYRLAMLTALAFMIVAPLPLQAHLGHPERSFEILVTPHFKFEGLLFGIALLVLPFVILYVLTKVLPPWPESQAERPGEA